ncbi:MAG TPA: hypothetical protein ENH67_13755 [Pseudoalteromonas sp.]|uniref:DUF1565 domain-containing protein n=1 Tax=marine sediment metagenome TaxID=412755 RepID=A0A0F9WAC1_9ZZZZ|nr:hypothetical protein [Pseudoalteromonas sp.]HDY93955.1 hypothetical protein [Pseudoalteromonas sp.]HDZ33917.1 hypothetical protein [Pseudoalteromonas sp.]
MNIYTITLSVVLTSFSVSSLSADIPVGPGTGSLQSAINSAETGDTLILSSGNYAAANDEVIFDKALTVRAESAESVVSINASILTHPQLSSPLEFLRFQGLKINGPHWCFKSMNVDNLEFLEISAWCSNITFEATNDITIIGSKFTATFDSLNVKADKMSVLGSVIDARDGVTVNANELDFIGNEVTSYYHSNSFNSSGTGGKLIAANRFNYRLTGMQYTKVHSTKEFRMLDASSSNVNNVVYRNNVFKIDLTNFTGFNDEGVLERIEFLRNVKESDYFYNNVMDFASLAIYQPASGVSDLGPMFDGKFGAFEGNIIINHNDDLFDPLFTENVKYNLGFNNYELFGSESSNLNAEPLLNNDYSLSPESPAVDSGPVAAYLSDLDLSRNDIGAYGGSWSIGQYDVQRANDAIGPFVYPVLDAQQGVANGELKLKLISYPRLK